MTHAIVIMGISGCGKSTLARALADALGWHFVEGDAQHPPQNIAKMAEGIPLNDADRWPFLESVAQAMVNASSDGIVVSCSALKRSYRNHIRARAGDDVLFVLPLLDRETLYRRLAERRDHFMPASLLRDQLANLEHPVPEENAILVDGTLATEAQVAEVLARLDGRPRSHTREVSP